MIRRVGEPPKADITYRLRRGAYAVLPVGRWFLMTAQTTTERPGFDLQLPGGGIDPGETPLQALHREIIEETGWTIARPRRLGAFRRFVYMPEYDLWAEKLCTVYVAHPVRQIAEPTEPDHSNMYLSGAEALETLGNDGDRMFLRRYLSS